MTRPIPIVFDAIPFRAIEREPLDFWRVLWSLALRLVDALRGGR